MPIRATAEVVGRYLGKYMAKGLSDGSVYKRDRRVSYCRRSWGWSTRFSWVNGVYRKKLAKIANELGFVWTDEEGFADFKFLLGPKWAVKLRDIVRGILLHRTEYPSDRLAVQEYAAHYERSDGQMFRLDDLVLTCNI